MDALQAEIAARLADSERQVSLAAMEVEYRALGYCFDRSLDCPSNWRNLSGPRAGKAYPGLSLSVREVDTGQSAYHFASRRDDKFEAMMKLRNDVFAVVRGRIAQA